MGKGLAMARTIGKLTALAVTQAKRRGYYGDGGGLWLQVSASGSKSWVFRYRVGSKLYEMGLGPLHTIGLSDARQKAQECRRARLDGKDPIAARRAERMATKLDAAKAITFQDCAERYIAAHKPG
ncbi:MAG TPA: Arm DNA-binding domain-containing protein, partial [Stellaceae bacterium]|nr:Arm DNA-binding domain-containing protein [Stellaceae bacterium]